MTVGSLFSGIGGFDLGLERAGMRVIWQSEIDPYASRVLARHWPDVPNLGDVTTIDWSTVERPQLVAGGFPCQPVSLAGKGRAQKDPRWLWPEFARCLLHVRPHIVLVENVRGLLQRGLADVLWDLADLGFDAEWGVLPASAFGAPHRRHRVLVVAHAQRVELWDEPGRRSREGRPRAAITGDDGRTGPVAHADGQRLPQRSQCNGETVGPGVEASFGHDPGRRRQSLADPVGQRLEVLQLESLVEELQALERGGDGWRHWEAEPDVGRVVDGLSPAVDRVARLRCLGNAMVPQVAEWLGRRVLAAEVAT